VSLKSLPQILRNLRWPLAVLAAALAGCIDDPVPRLRVGTFLRPGFEPLFLARSLGFYSDQRIQFVEFPTAAEMLLAYRNHAIDAATVTTDDVLRLAADGQEPRIVLVMGYSNGADAVLAKPTVSSLNKLKGQKVGVESNGLGGYVLARALDSSGLTLADVQIVSGRADRVERDYAINNVEAVAVSEPYRTHVVRRPTVTIFDSTKMPGEIADVLIVPASMAAQPHPALRELFDGWFRALDHLGAQSADAVERMAPREAMTPDQFKAALALFTFLERRESLRQINARDTPLIPAMQRMGAFMAKNGMLPGEVNVPALLQNPFPLVTP
jgi:NitT/TauT family transport system substrate-binding protein